MPDFVTFQPRSVADEVRPHSHSSPRSKVHCAVLRLHLLLRRQGSRPTLPHFLLPLVRPLWPPVSSLRPLGSRAGHLTRCKPLHVRARDAVNCYVFESHKAVPRGVWPPKICIQEVKHSNERREERRGDGIIISVITARMPHIKCVHMRS